MAAVSKCMCMCIACCSIHICGGWDQIRGEHCWQTLRTDPSGTPASVRLGGLATWTKVPKDKLTSEAVYINIYDTGHDKVTQISGQTRLYLKLSIHDDGHTRHDKL